MQLGCNKTSEQLPRAPKVAIGAVKLQLVTSGCWIVTADAVGSTRIVSPRLLPPAPILSRPPQIRGWHSAPGTVYGV